MLKQNLNDLICFIVVAKEQSFTRAAIKLGISQSALSHSMRNLEERLQLRLLSRTTRKVSTTYAGEQLCNTLAPLFDTIEDEILRLKENNDKTSGHIKISAGEHATDWLLWPKIKPFLKEYPAISVEIEVDNSWVDIVEERFDAGVRMGNNIDKDMIAIKISEDSQIKVVASPEYLHKNPVPKIPQELTKHSCINMRLPSIGNLLPWEFIIDGKVNHIEVKGQIIVNTLRQRIDAALNGYGFAYVPSDTVKMNIENGELISVLDEFCMPLSGYYLYYPSRKFHTVAFNLFVQHMKLKS